MMSAGEYDAEPQFATILHDRWLNPYDALLGFWDNPTIADGAEVTLPRGVPAPYLAKFPALQPDFWGASVCFS